MEQLTGDVYRVSPELIVLWLRGGVADVVVENCLLSPGRDAVHEVGSGRAGLDPLAFVDEHCRLAEGVPVRDIFAVDPHGQLVGRLVLVP